MVATVHNLLKIEVQTLDGEALTLGSDALDSPGFTGWRCYRIEGMLGVTTEVTVKLVAETARGAGSVSQL